ncbi:MAG: DNRLRE domain-containing protein [candidate division Zixibacteria bacterium]|nr:DNRLRE domain-containing protein [candidate division Zixibacteria bacterium]
MKNAAKLLVLFLALGILTIGCQNEPNMMGSPEPSSMGQTGMAKLVIPAGATLESAKLFIYEIGAHGHTVNVHRITADWQELVVTWNNFGSSYDPAIFGSFVADAVGWKMVDVTTLVQGWLDGTYDDFGLLLDQVDEVYPRCKYHSRENAEFQPYLEVCYSVGGATTCDVADDIADTYIYQNDPNSNRGGEIWLYTGWYNDMDLEKQVLIKFDLEVDEEEDGCSHTIGYWKTHAGFGPQADVVTPLLPIWLGDAGGAKSLPVTTATIAVNVLKMKTYGDGSNGITKLYAQLLGAKLSIADGAGDAAIADAIDDADAFLANHNWMDWEGLSEEDRDMVMGWQDMFDDYNNGYIGPGHCDEDDGDAY